MSLPLNTFSLNRHSDGYLTISILPMRFKLP